MKTNKQITNIEQIGELSFKDMVALWKKHRALFFLKLKKDESLTNDEIAQRFGQTRQAVGQMLTNAKE